MKIGRIVLALRVCGIGERVVMKVLHGNAVAAIVGIVGGVQGLVHVADKMDQVADRFGALHRIGRGVLQDGALRFNCASHATLGAAVFVQRTLLFSSWDINVMPGAVVALVAD